MKKLPLSSHLADVSPLAFGCMGLGSPWDTQPISGENIKQAHTVIDSALDAGINLFDHADIYNLGKAEKSFAQVLKTRPALRDSIYIQSKCGIRFEDESGPKRYDLSGQWITSSVDGILNRLDCNHIDILLLHRPDPLMEPREIAETFANLKTAGKVKYFGVSNMNGAQLALLQDALSEPLVVNQIEISLQHLDWLNEMVMTGNPTGTHRNFTPGTLEYCQLNHVQLQAWGSLSQGLFSGRDLSDASRHIKRTAQLVECLAAEYQVAGEAIVLSFLMRHPAAIQPVIGTTSSHRIKACAQAPTVQLSREHWYQLFVASRGEILP